MTPNQPIKFTPFGRPTAQSLRSFASAYWQRWAAMRRVTSQLIVITCLVLSSMAKAELGPSLVRGTASAQLREKLELASCRRPHSLAAEQFDAWREEGRRELHYVEVSCISHESYLGQPAKFIAHCYEENTEWTCSQEGVRLSFSTDYGNVEALLENVTNREANDIAHYLVQVAFFQGFAVRTAVLQNGCSFSRKGDDLLIAECGLLTLTVSLWCPQAECPRLIAANTHVY